jgi:hypothetical protein
MSVETGISGPHISAAFLVEKVLLEKDGAPSFIRVVERFTVPMFQPPPGGFPPGIQIPQPILQVTLVVMLKAGGIGGGKYGIQIKGNSPTGKPMPENRQSVFLNGSDDNGVMLAMPIMLMAPEEGLYWFDVCFEEMLLTRVPLRVLYQQAVAVQFPQERRGD